MVRVLMLVLLGGVGAGCATLKLGGDFRSIGHFAEGRDRDVKQRYEALAEQPAVVEGISVLIDALPAGLSMRNGSLAVVDGYQHQILGRFTVTSKARFFPAYEQNWRRYYCYWQLPLAVGTLGLWAVVVPLYYPCWSTSYRSKAAIVEQARRLGHSAGGDLVIMSFIRPRTDVDEATGAYGFVLRADRRLRSPTAPAPLAPARPQTIDTSVQ